MAESEQPITRETTAAPGAGVLDELAFERLAAKHRPRALCFALAFLGDRDAAEDAFQEALKRLYERRTQYPLAAHFGPYLIKTMANVCVDEKRARREAPLASRSHQAAPAAVSRDDDPAGAAEKRETAALIAKAVAGLGQRERACFLLTVCEGLSYREAGEALSLSFNDVNNAVRNARLALRETLGPLLECGTAPKGGRA